MAATPFQGSRGCLGGGILGWVAGALTPQSLPQCGRGARAVQQQPPGVWTWEGAADWAMGHGPFLQNVIDLKNISCVRVLGITAAYHLNARNGPRALERRGVLSVTRSRSGPLGLSGINRRFVDARHSPSGPRALGHTRTCPFWPGIDVGPCGAVWDGGSLPCALLRGRRSGLLEGPWAPQAGRSRPTAGG